MNGKTTVTRPKSIRARMQPAQVDLGFRWGRLNSALLGLGVLALALGYVSLSRGSITLAPILLVTGYCAVIPAALLVRGSGSGEGE